MCMQLRMCHHQGVLWEARQPSPRGVQLLHPDFAAYARDIVAGADSGALAVLLAMHRCHNVTLFGFTLNTSSVDASVPYHYYDGCDKPADAVRDARQAQLLHSLALGGLLHVGEPCWQQCTSAGQEVGCRQCQGGHPLWVAEPSFPAAEDCDASAASVGHNATLCFGNRRCSSDNALMM